ncbi:MAG: hypothetical protein B6242_04075 [Anaerolineaceae bacterium 4572_78]|nr:MAG: hypothetical protein B6242_04075 [Anaerolineaceae bacterium 4572_78]
MITETIDDAKIKTKLYQLIDQLPTEILANVLQLLESLMGIFQQTEYNGNNPNSHITLNHPPTNEDTSNQPDWMVYVNRLSTSPLKDEFLEAMAEVRQEFNQVEEYEDELVYS